MPCCALFEAGLVSAGSPGQDDGLRSAGHDKPRLAADGKKVAGLCCSRSDSLSGTILACPRHGVFRSYLRRQWWRWPEQLHTVEVPSYGPQLLFYRWRWERDGEWQRAVVRPDVCPRVAKTPFVIAAMQSVRTTGHLLWAFWLHSVRLIGRQMLRSLQTSVGVGRLCLIVLAGFGICGLGQH